MNEREEFEEFAKSKNWSVEKSILRPDDDSYKYTETEFAYQAWQAALNIRDKQEWISIADAKVKFRGRLLHGKDFVEGSLIETSLRYGSKFEIKTLNTADEEDPPNDAVHEIYYPTVEFKVLPYPPNTGTTTND